MLSFRVGRTPALWRWCQNGVASGNVVVTASGLQSNGVPFTVLVPTIAGLNPSSAEPLDTVIISGSNFGRGGTATLNGQEMGINSWTDTSISASVQSAACGGNVV